MDCIFLLGLVSRVLFAPIWNRNANSRSLVAPPRGGGRRIIQSKFSRSSIGYLREPFLYNSRVIVRFLAQQSCHRSRHMMNNFQVSFDFRNLACFLCFFPSPSSFRRVFPFLFPRLPTLYPPLEQFIERDVQQSVCIHIKALHTFIWYARFPVLVLPWTNVPPQGIVSWAMSCWWGGAGSRFRRVRGCV